jgi:hypothetical protein
MRVLGLIGKKVSGEPIFSSHKVFLARVPDPWDAPLNSNLMS